MKVEGENREIQQAKKPSNQNNYDQSNNERPCCCYLLSWVLFLLAIGVYVGIWAISKYLVTAQTSYYYNVDHFISPYVSANPNAAACDTIVANTTLSTAIYVNGQSKTTQAIALQLIFTWLMWKLPMAFFMLNLIFQAQNRIIKYVSWGVSLGIMLAVDILLTVFLPLIYQEYMFYAFASLLAILLGVINNKEKRLVSAASAFFPLFFIALLYFSYSYFIPTIFNLIVTNVSSGFQYLMIYGYIVLDLIFYSLLLVMNARESLKLARPLLASIQFFLIGYFVGICLLVSITEVQFYYLVGYMLFRNFFSNWIMYRWEKVVNNPPCLPGWGIIYYASYLLNFLPIIGFGRLVLSNSFASQQFSQSCLLLSYYPSNQYPYNTVTPAMADGMNLSFAGFVFWPGALIIWFISLITQTYPRKRITLFEFFYNMCGIYMFYLGISGGLQLLTLRQVGLP